MLSQATARARLLGPVLALLLAACPEAPPVAADAARSDASTPDVTAPDTGSVDTALPDLVLPDAQAPDTAAVDRWIDPCPAGSLGCACSSGDACDDPLQCVLDECLACERGALDCRCLDNGACLVGAVCRADNVCVPCTRGSEACFCQDDGACDDGLSCEVGVCVPASCVAGDEGCACDQGQCALDLYCGQSGSCLACSTDVVGCACDAGACSNGLVCDALSALCRAPLGCDDVVCLPQQLCEYRARADAACVEDCAAGYRWDELAGACEPVRASCDPGTADSILDTCDALHMHCVAVEAQAACVGCLPGFVAVDSADPIAGCRAVVDCPALHCAAVDRSCVPATAVADATCGACLPPLVEGDAGACIANPDANCNDPSDPDSIVEACATAHRLCDDSGVGARCADCILPYVESAYSGLCELTGDCGLLGCDALHRACSDVPNGHCTGCLPGFVDEGGTCRPVIPFDALTCDAATPFKVHETPTRDAHCISKPCPDGQASNGATCVTSCPATCAGAGQTGRLWPHTLQTGRCICESADGHYFDATTLSQQPCDFDGDGWTRLGARASLRSTDEELRANARCQLRQIDRFTLRNEFAQSRTVVSCSVGDEAFRGPFDAPCEGEARPIDLYEVNYLDDDDALALQGPAAYGAGARRLGARELNSLTKACSGPNDDFNGNELADVGEWAGSSFPFSDPAKREALSPFLGFTSFLELNTGSFQASDFGPIGTWVVAERPRCSGELPLEYAASEGPYHAGCTRSRAARYDLPSGRSLAGLDFARYSCAAEAGSCGIPSPILGATVPGAERVHDLCAVTVPPSGWLGMSHHSQFQCVLVTSQAPADPLATPYEHAQAELFDGSGGAWQFNRCDATATTSQGAANADQPSFSCSAVARGSVPVTSVGFAALRYQDHSPASAYGAGCINECASWLSICPGYTSSPATNQASCHPDLGNFGEIVCGRCAHEGQACDTGQRGVCAAGTYVCSNDVESCVRTTAPTVGDDWGDGVDSNCDGFDGVLAGHIFVAPWGNDNSAGTVVQLPKKSLQAAIDAAFASSYDVIAYAGTYSTDLSVALANGVSIHGGVVNSGCPATQLLCQGSELSAVVSTASKAVQAIGITAPTWIYRLSFKAASAAGTTGRLGRSSYGLYLNASSSSLEFEECVFEAGAATAGLAGTGYPEGQADHVALAGNNGAQGHPGIRVAPNPLGGFGGAARICSDGSLSGSGGMGGAAGHGNNPGTAGGGGGGPDGSMSGGLGGTGTAPGLGPACPALSAAGGTYLQPVPSGSNGEAVAASFDADGFMPAMSGSGTQGGNGYGGGGGGGGGGWAGLTYLFYGASGGGGGSGGCGGYPGMGGAGGGASIAVYLNNASPVFTSCSFKAATAGAGGAGGEGQVGGPAGSGGKYQLPSGCYAGSAYGGSDTSQQKDASMGGAGGDGTKGGDGGHGAGGAGGAAVCVYKGGSSDPMLSPALVLDDTCVLPASAAAGGTSAAAGAAGAAGVRAMVYP